MIRSMCVLTALALLGCQEATDPLTPPQAPGAPGPGQEVVKEPCYLGEIHPGDAIMEVGGACGVEEYTLILAEPSRLRIWGFPTLQPGASGEIGRWVMVEFTGEGGPSTPVFFSGLRDSYAFDLEAGEHPVSITWFHFSGVPVVVEASRVEFWVDVKSEAGGAPRS